MTAYRIVKQNNYTVVDNAFIKDARLSFKAKGILLYLLSRPDNWSVYESDIIKQSNDGRRAVRSGVQELIEVGYIERQQKRNDKKQFAGYEYVVHEQIPLSRFATTENAISENGTLLNTDVTNYLNNQVRDKDNDNGSEPVTRSNHAANHDTNALSFYDWYVAKCYPHYKKAPHPRLKNAQREKVLNALDSFIDEMGVDLEGLSAMANNYFQKMKSCDHNINHFATEGILTNRYYEECY